MALGTPGVVDGRNPTLIPDFDVSNTSSRGELVKKTRLELQQAGDALRVNATAYATVGGVPVDLDTITATLTFGGLLNGSLAVTVTAATDTAASLALKLRNALNLALKPYGAYADIQTGTAARVNIFWPGQGGNSVGLVATTSGGAATLTASAALLTGGSGPIIPLNNVQIVDLNGNLLDFRAGLPQTVSAALLTQLLSAGILIS